ncbi:MAG: signal peptidase I [Oscillospiraceae bacterium]|jgi:signal peptidase I|nr:signal peptidase I [Oscillospiraceae bacterium]
MLQTPSPETKSKKAARGIIEWLRSLIIALAGALFITVLIAQPITVQGSSMMNTLQNRDLMIATKFDYIFGDPDRFDVVICRYPGRGSTNFVKRVVGLPGDQVAMVGGVLFVNGEEVREDYIDFPADYYLPEVTVAPGHYFVLGDNRSNSNDSHFEQVGQLARDQIIGRVRWVIWPLWEMRSIE